MKITIDDKVLEKYKMTKAQFFFMLSIHNKLTEPELESLLNRKFYISQSYTGGLPQHNFFLSHAGIATMNKIILESDSLNTNQKNRLEELTKTLQSMFPEGRKAGTNNYWRGNSTEIKERLQAFFKKFGDYSDEVVINATQRYIDSFQHNQTTMRILKYFISKKDGAEWNYDLLTWIENANTPEDSGVLDTQRLI